MDNLTAHEEIDIVAPPERVWQVLTDPELTRRYMFGCVPITDWRVGSSLAWQGTLDGKNHVFVAGALLAVEPPALLSYTTYDPSAAAADPPARWVRVVCRLTSPRPGTTHLEVSQGDFAGLPDADRRYQETRAGWRAVVTEIKKIAESS